MTARAAAVSNLNPAWKAALALALGVFCIGFSAIFIKLAGLPSAVSGFYRMFVALLVLTPLTLMQRPVWPTRRALVATMAGGVFFAGDLLCWNASLLRIPAATATLLGNSAPLWVGLGSLLFFRAQLTRWYWIGLAVALTGALIVMNLSGAGGIGGSVGELLAVAAGVFYAAYLMTTQRVRVGVDALFFSTLMAFAACVVLFLSALMAGDPFWGYSSQTWLALLGVGLVSQVGGWLMINYALGHLPASRVSVSLLAQPVITALAAMAVLGEAVGPRLLVGGVLVLAGIYLVYRR